MKYYSSINPLPAYGQLAQDSTGNYICHICGKAFKKVLSHATQKHGITAQEYKHTFGLYSSKGLLAPESKRLARQRNAENRSVVIDQNLIVGGSSTRFKNNSRGRTKDQMCEQLRQSLRERNPLVHMRPTSYEEEEQNQ